MKCPLKPMIHVPPSQPSTPTPTPGIHHQNKLLQLTNQPPQSLRSMATSVVTPLAYIKRDKEGGRG